MLEAGHEDDAFHLLRQNAGELFSSAQVYVRGLYNTRDDFRVPEDAHLEAAYELAQSGDDGFPF